MIGRALSLAAAAAGLYATAAHADPAGEAVIRDLVADIDALPRWEASTGAIRSEGEDTIVEALRLSAEGGQAFTIGFARFRGLAATADGGVAASQIEWRDTDYDSDLFDMTMPALAARDVSLPDPATLVIDPSAPLTSVAAFYTAWTEARIGAAQAPSIAIVQTTPGPGEATPLVSHAAYSDVKLTDLSGGTIATFESGRVETRTEGSSTSELDIGSLAIETINFGTFAHVLDEANYRNGFGDGIWRPAIGQALYSDLAGTATDGTRFEMAEIGIRNVEARQPAQPFTERLDSLQEGADPDDREAQRLAIGTLSDLFSAFRLGSASIRELAVHPSDASDTSATIASMSLTALSAEGFENFSLHDFSTEAPQGFARIASIDVADFRFPEFEAFSRLFELSEPDADPAARDEAIRAMLDALPRFTRASMAGLAAGLADQEPVTLDQFDMSTEKYVGPFPTVSRVSVEGLTIPGALMRMEPQAARMLDRFNYDDITFGLFLQEIWMPDEARSLTNVTLDVEDAMNVELAYTYTGIDEDWVIASIARAADVEDESETEAMMAGLEGLNLEAATLKLTDRSLTDRVLGYVAERQGLSVDGATYRQQLRGALPFLLSTVLPGKVSNLLMAPLQDYLGGGKSLVLEAKPENPVPLTSVVEAAGTDPVSLVDLLGAAASTEEAP